MSEDEVLHTDKGKKSDYAEVEFEVYNINQVKLTIVPPFYIPQERCGDVVRGEFRVVEGM